MTLAESQAVSEAIANDAEQKLQRRCDACNETQATVFADFAKLCISCAVALEVIVQ